MRRNQSSCATGTTTKMSSLKWVPMVWKRFMSNIQALKKGVAQLHATTPKPENGLGSSDMKIVKVPNKILTTPGVPVVIAPPVNFIKNMGALMILKHGAGLAANQVGINQTFFIANFGSEFTVCINPKIIRHGKQILETPEGCLSILDNHGQFIYKMIKRWEVIDVSYYTMDGFYSGNKTLRTFKRFEAKLFQHEMDHMKGVLCNA